MIYKRAFKVSFGHYEWNMVPFRILHQSFRILWMKYSTIYKFTILYIDGALVYAESLDQKHLKFSVFNIITKLQTVKMRLFWTKIRFPGHNIYQGTPKYPLLWVWWSNKIAKEIKKRRWRVPSLSLLTQKLSLLAKQMPHKKVIKVSSNNVF